MARKKRLTDSQLSRLRGGSSGVVVPHRLALRDTQIEEPAEQLRLMSSKRNDALVPHPDFAGYRPITAHRQFTF